ncbi:hypothetical protein Tco_0960136 [Tanacetum coccineum]
MPPDTYSVQAPFGGCDRLVSRAKVYALFCHLDFIRLIQRRGHLIPVGRPYRTQPNGVLQILTARKRVGPLPTHRLALRYSADYSSSDQFTSDDSSRDSYSDFSSKTSSDSHSDYSSDSSLRHSS